MKESRISHYLTKGLVNRRSNLFTEKFVSLLFRGMDFDAESLAKLNESYEGKRAVFVSFQSTTTSMLILINLLRRHGFGIPALALDFTPNLIQIFSNSYRKISRIVSDLISREKRHSVSTYDYMKDLLGSGSNIIISLLSRKSFLRRFVEIKSDALQILVEIQMKTDEPIYIFPQITYWNRNPDRTKMLLISKATGDRGLFSALFTMFKSATPAFVRIAVPINLKEEIAGLGTDDSAHITRKIRNRLLDIYANDKKCVLGPVIKSQQEMIEKVLYHKNVLDTIDELIKEGGKPETKLRKKAFKYFREIAADFSIVYVVYFVKIMVWVYNKIFDGILYSIDDFAKVREAANKAPLVIVPCHRSHMDYLIISSMLYLNSIVPPHIVAGANLTFWPMGKIFRRSGAFFIRRSFKGKKLYTSVLKQYIKSLVNEGYNVKFFIEGGRTRTGKIGFPKMGILKYLVDAVDEGYAKDLMIVPVSINYDRVLEESSYHFELMGNKKKNESTKDVIKSVNFLKRNYGHVYLDFHEPFSFQEYKSGLAQGEDVVNSLGNHIVKNINEIVTVTPFSLVSTALLLAPAEGFTKDSIVYITTYLYDFLVASGAHMPEKLKSQEQLGSMVDNVIKTYGEDGIVVPLIQDEEPAKKYSDGKEIYILNEDDRPKLNFYQSSIVHYFISISFLALSILTSQKDRKVSLASISSEYSLLIDLFSKEFLYPYNMDDMEAVIKRDIDFLSGKSIVSVSRARLSFDENGHEHLLLYSRIMQDYLESYYIAFSKAVELRRSSISKKDFIHEVRKGGIKMYQSGSVHLTESLSLPNYNNAVAKMEELNIISEAQSGRGAEYSISNQNKATEIISRIKAYLDMLA